ncbi:MAG: hypothetical protein A2Y77_10120 [Planctomycetes bacterium RBG_13_62_9]|nr:MAG: hypothetical protein A2Y77_10120 [Planctomycetes bacterium RBG_13_62_9]
MTLGSPSHIVYKKHTFLSSAAMGLSAVLIAIIASCTVVVLYGVHLAGEKSERVITLAQSAIRGLPEFAESLPPMLSDMLDDHRQPDYSNQLAITTRLTREPGRGDGARTEIEIINNGEEVVSLLGLRIIALDESGRLLCESQEWAATPFATDGGLRGPIMPGSRRYFVGARRRLCDPGPMETVKTEVEITELRLWNGPQKDVADNPKPTNEATASAPSSPGPLNEG